MAFLASFFHHFKKSFFLIVISLSLLACGKKGPLYVPTEAQREQMAKEQAERDKVLQARETKRKQTETNGQAATD